MWHEFTALGELHKLDLACDCISIPAIPGCPTLAGAANVESGGAYYNCLSPKNKAAWYKNGN